MRDGIDGHFVGDIELQWTEEEPGFPDNKVVDVGEEDFDWYEDDSALIDAAVGGAHRSSGR